MPEQASPRGTYLKIAEVVRGRVEADPDVTELPSAAELMEEFGISRGVALRAFRVLEKERVAVPAPGERWQAVREGEDADRRPLAERVAEVITRDGLEVGDPFPSASALSVRFGVSRPTVSKALGKLESDGLLSEGRQGRARTVRAVPGRP